MKRYVITRQTRKFVWLRWDKYGPSLRGLSFRLEVEDFRLKYAPCQIHDSIQETQKYFKLETEKIIN